MSGIPIMAPLSTPVLVTLSIFLFHCTCGKSTSPQMPQIPETYTTSQTIIQLVGAESIRQIVVYRNFETGKQLIISSIYGNDSLGYVDVLTRVDVKRKFQYFLPYRYCLDISRSGGVTIDKAWNWTTSSKYKEQRFFSGKIVNVWAYEEENLYQEVGVLLGDANVPVFYFKADDKAQSATLVTFESFTANTPEDFLFEVPQACQYKIHNNV